MTSRYLEESFYMNSTKLLSSQVKVTKQVKIELTKLLYKNLYVSIPILFILASVIALALEPYTNLFYLKTWYLTVAGLLLLRGALIVWYTYTKTRHDLYRLHYSLFIVIS